MCSVPMFLGPVPEDGFPKDAKPGCMLAGSLKIAHTSPLAGDKHAPGACPLVFSVPPPAKKDPEDSAEKDDVAEEKDAVQKMRDAQRDAQVTLRFMIATCMHTSMHACMHALPLSVYEAGRQRGPLH